MCCIKVVSDILRDERFVCAVCMCGPAQTRKYMTVSLSVASSSDSKTMPGAGMALLFSQIVSRVGCSWVGGFGGVG